jgi:hypothetical protein
MKRIATSIGIVALLMAFGLALGGGHGDGPPPPHGHVLLLGLQFDGEGEVIGFRTCVDLANGRALRINAHHDHLHTGRAGAAVARAGHAVVPNSPLTPWNDCAELKAYYGLE